MKFQAPMRGQQKACHHRCDAACIVSEHAYADRVQRVRELIRMGNSSATRIHVAGFRYARPANDICITCWIELVRELLRGHRIRAPIRPRTSRPAVQSSRLHPHPASALQSQHARAMRVGTLSAMRLPEPLRAVVSPCVQRCDSSDQSRDVTLGESV